MQLPFASGKLPMTKSFMHYIVQLTAMATLLAVALLLGLQWRTVKNIDKQNLAKRAKQFSFKKLRYISVDEIAIKKRHKYMTIFTDISTGQIIYVVEGRNEEVLRPFLHRLARKARHLRGIGMDMSAAYASSIRKNLPNMRLLQNSSGIPPASEFRWSFVKTLWSLLNFDHFSNRIVKKSRKIG